MPLKTTGQHGWVAFQSGVRFSMRVENGKTLLVTVDADVLDFFEPEIADGDVQCFLRHRASTTVASSSMTRSRSPLAISATSEIVAHL